MIRLALSISIAAIGAATASDCTNTQAVEVTRLLAGWQEISSAPKDRQILLGLMTEEGFALALGHWDVRDELGGGNWTAEDWWGIPPTHWTQVPPPPCSKD